MALPDACAYRQRHSAAVVRYKKSSYSASKPSQGTAATARPATDLAEPLGRWAASAPRACYGDPRAAAASANPAWRSIRHAKARQATVKPCGATKPCTRQLIATRAACHPCQASHLHRPRNTKLSKSLACMTHLSEVSLEPEPDCPLLELVTNALEHRPGCRRL